MVTVFRGIVQVSLPLLLCRKVSVLYFSLQSKYHCRETHSDAALYKEARINEKIKPKISVYKA